MPTFFYSSDIITEGIRVTHGSSENLFSEKPGKVEHHNMYTKT